MIARLFDYADFTSELYTSYAFIPGWENLNRKAWENFALTEGLEKLGALKGVGLGLGCGREALLRVFPQRLNYSIVIDTAYVSKDCYPWEHFTPRQIQEWSGIDESRLLVLPADMRQIPFKEESFDVVWSNSSIEHIGDVSTVLHCFADIERVLRPDGVCGITTEWNLTGTKEVVYFHQMVCFDYNLLRMISQAAPGLQLVEEPNVERSTHPSNQCRGYLAGRTHDVRWPVDFTSVSLFWRKRDGS